MVNEKDWHAQSSMKIRRNGLFMFDTVHCFDRTDDK